MFNFFLNQDTSVKFPGGVFEWNKKVCKPSTYVKCYIDVVNEGKVNSNVTVLYFNIIFI